MFDTTVAPFTRVIAISLISSKGEPAILFFSYQASLIYHVDTLWVTYRASASSFVMSRSWISSGKIPGTKRLSLSKTEMFKLYIFTIVFITQPSMSYQSFIQMSSDIELSNLISLISFSILIGLERGVFVSSHSQIIEIKAPSKPLSILKLK